MLFCQVLFFKRTGEKLRMWASNFFSCFLRLPPHSHQPLNPCRRLGFLGLDFPTYTGSTIIILTVALTAVNSFLFFFDPRTGMFASFLFISFSCFLDTLRVCRVSHSLSLMYPPPHHGRAMELGCRNTCRTLLRPN